MICSGFEIAKMSHCTSTSDGFSKMRIKVPSISDNEAIEAFITGLCFHDALRDKLLHKRPESVTALLATAKKMRMPMMLKR